MPTREFTSKLRGSDSECPSAKFELQLLDWNIRFSGIVEPTEANCCGIADGWDKGACSDGPETTASRTNRFQVSLAPI